MYFFKDELGEIVVKAVSSGLKNPALEPLVANTVEASREKHLPEITVDGNKISVRVGSVEHPMTDAHYIQLIALDTKKGFLIRRLDPTDKPEAFFCIDHDDVAEAVFAYCNLHGLWKTEL